jgi:hypothetical protein
MSNTRVRRIIWIRRVALIGLLAFSLKLLLTGLILPALDKTDSVFIQQTEKVCSTNSCSSGSNFSILNIIFGLMAGYWFLKEYKQTRKFGVYTSASPSDMQWALISVLFLIPGMIFYVLAMAAVILSFVKPGIYTTLYSKVINY